MATPVLGWVFFSRQGLEVMRRTDSIFLVCIRSYFPRLLCRKRPQWTIDSGEDNTKPANGSACGRRIRRVQISLGDVEGHHAQRPHFAEADLQPAYS